MCTYTIDVYTSIIFYNCINKRLLIFWVLILFSGSEGNISMGWNRESGNR